MVADMYDINALEGSKHPHPGMIEPDWNDATNRPPWVQFGVDAPGLPDEGEELLESMASQLMWDEWRLDRAERSVRWWAAETPLELSVSRPGLVFGDPTIKMTVEVPIVEGVSAPNERVFGLLSILNLLSPIGTLAFDPANGRVSSFVTHYAHPGNRSVMDTRLFGTLVMIAYIEALEHVESGAMARSWGATSPVVAAGNRQGIEPDQMLELVDTHVIPTGLSQSAWGASDFQEAHRWFREGNWLTLGAEERGTTAEFPFGTNDEPYQAVVREVGEASNHKDAMTAFALYKEMSIGGEGMDTALFSMGQSTHPEFGSGLMMDLTLPPKFSDPHKVANTLNLLEAKNVTAIPAWGTWTASYDEHQLVKWMAFLPNMAYRLGYMPALAGQAMMRSFWARHWYFDGGSTL